MGWSITCADPKCGKESWASNIVDLITKHRDEEGWFVCSCGKRGYIKKSFQLQEVGEVWEPFLRGIIPLGTAGGTYQPFVFLVSYEPTAEVTDVWFSYYKDLRSAGGRLKLGYGPGGPPVLGKAAFLGLVSHLVQAKCLTPKEVIDAVTRPSSNNRFQPTVLPPLRSGKPATEPGRSAAARPCAMTTIADSVVFGRKGTHTGNISRLIAADGANSSMLRPAVPSTGSATEVDLNTVPIGQRGDRMRNYYSSKWTKLWNRWSYYEHRWQNDDRRCLITSLVAASMERCDTVLAAYRQNTKIAQPSQSEVDELVAMGDVFRTLAHGDIYPDVYAAACSWRSRRLPFSLSNDDGTVAVGFRGTRNATWEFVPTILRDLPDGAEREQERKRRYRDLALFCEAMRQLLDKDGKESSEDVCMAIAQHYGIRSPLIDLTSSPWVALFFASHSGQEGDDGVVQCFPLRDLEGLSKIGSSNFGQLRIVRADFVPRIRNQKGFFIELPAHRLDHQLVPYTIRFKQQESVTFQDDYLGVSESLIYPSDANDPFAPFAKPALKTYPYPSVPNRPPSTSADYFAYAEVLFREWNMGIDDSLKSLVQQTCDFHHRLQSIDELTNVERSLQRFTYAVGMIRISRSNDEELSFQDIIATYKGHSSEETWPLILKTGNDLAPQRA